MPARSSAPRGSFKKRQGRGSARTNIRSAIRESRTLFPGSEAALNDKQAAHGHEPSLVASDKDVDHANESRTLEPLPAAGGSCWDKIDHPRLTREDLQQWKMHAHVDHVYDMVPFWQRGIDAAEKGQVLRLEEFLDKMEGDGGWRTVNEVLGMMDGWKASPSERDHDYGGWGKPRQGDWAAEAWESNEHGWATSQKGGWSVGSPRIASDTTEPSRVGGDSGWGIRKEWARPDFKVGLQDTAADAIQDGCGVHGRAKPVQAVRGGGREDLHHFVDAIARQEAVDEERRQKMHLFSSMPLDQKIQKIQEIIRFLRTHA